MNSIEKRKRKIKFGKMIRDRRKMLGISAETLAERCNRSDRDIRDIELGKREPLLGTALILCQVCEIDVGELKEFVPQGEPTYVWI